MRRIFLIGSLVWCITSCFAQDGVVRPSFPDVFQTEIEGTFVQEKAVVEIDATVYYDRTNNRAALSFTKEGEVTMNVYDFDGDESFVIDGNDCEVDEIPDKGFFPFTKVDGKKKLSPAEEAFFFSKSELDTQIQKGINIPTLVYKVNVDVPRFGKSNCDITHIFSKPDLELPTCKEGIYCNSTLMSMSVTCKNAEGRIDVTHSYRFSRFKYEIEDDSVFSPPPGFYCPIKNTKPLPDFPSYFSFSFDIIEKFKGSYNSATFNTHKKVWYDAEYSVIRIDEYDYKGLLYSSRVFDFKAGAAFIIIPSVEKCSMSSIPKQTRLDKITGLPRTFFYQKDSDVMKEVYVKKRKVHGLEYEVWSFSWKDKESEARIVEDVYFLQVSPDKSTVTDKNMRLQISHINMYFYETSGESKEDELTLLRYFSINNFRSSPKEWAAFDIATCFRSSDRTDFLMKIQGPQLIKESPQYKKVLQLLYGKIIAETNVSIIRISELGGIFDGTDLLGIKGSIINNSESSGWPTQSEEPGMEETFELMKNAVEGNKLSVILKENGTVNIYKVTSLTAVQVTSGDFQKPSLPDVFQTDIEGTFIQDGITSMQASMFYDRQNNRAALFVTKDGQITKSIYDFDRDEKLSINGNDCSVEEISPDQLFLKFTSTGGKKKLVTGDEVFSFTDSELDKRILPENVISVVVYTARVPLPLDSNIICDITHIFSKPDLGQSACREGLQCDATLMSMTVKCKDEQGQTAVDNSYSFSRFKSEIEDESAFMIPPGIHCGVKNTKPFPIFPSYFSFTFDIFEKPSETEDLSAIFSTHKEVWYDAEYRILRVDEFDNNELPYSSRIFDLKAEVAFTIVSSVPTCDIGPITGNISVAEITRLPRAFFSQSDLIADSAVYIGKRNVHGLDYDVWSLLWTDTESGARIVEEIYFLEVTHNDELTSENIENNTVYLQISHIDMYAYESNEDSDTKELTLQKYFSINNYRSKPKEWVAFDVDVCFENKQKMEFILKVKGPNLLKGSQSYREALELLYEKIIANTGVSVVRISELTGIFDGVHLLEISGSILDNSESTGLPQYSKEPDMKETFQLLKKAVLKDKLSITFIGDNNVEVKITVTSVEAIQVPSHSKNDCFSGASMAAASLVLLLVGMLFGIAGYYVFLKKRRKPLVFLRMSDIEAESKHEDDN